MTTKTEDENWVPHTKEELDKEMNRQKQLAEREKEAVEELKRIHSGVTSGGLRKQVSVESASPKVDGVVAKSLTPLEETQSKYDNDSNATAEREIVHRATVVKSEQFKEDRDKQNSESSPTSTCHVETSTAEPQGEALSL